MKVLSIEEAQKHFAAICEDALKGEVVRLQLPNGVIQLTPIPQIEPLSEQQLAECYEDEEWAAFENNCGKASD